MAFDSSSAAAAAKAPLRHKPLRKQVERESKLPFGDIPSGPLEVFISINQQRLHFYSDGVRVADVPVATGVPGHSTPLGIFSVIQRDRYHHSNLYSNAPMPFMERITWSGVALHEGPGVGHQASHGCIRMPGDFAARLWRLHTMGMRVVISGPELQPLPFADPHLFVHMDAPAAPPTPAVAVSPPVQTAQKNDPVLRTDALDAPVDGSGSTALPANPNVDPPGDPAHAATRDPAAPAAANAGASSATTAVASPVTSQSAAPVTSDPPALLAQPGKAKDPTLAEPSQPAAVGASTQSKPLVSASADPAGTSGVVSAQSQAAPASPHPADPPPPAAAAATPSSGIVAPDAAPAVPIPLSKPAQLGKDSGPIAIFISRKTSKIYVRQDFTPVFDAPVKIAHADQPLGTHLYTAMDYLPDHSTFRWTVVSLPATTSKTIERWRYVRDVYGRIHRLRVQERQAEAAPPPDTPEDALARIEIPKDVIAQISRLIVPGSSLIVSDEGLGPETGAGTDFIVVAR